MTYYLSASGKPQAKVEPRVKDLLQRLVPELVERGQEQKRFGINHSTTLVIQADRICDDGLAPLAHCREGLQGLDLENVQLSARSISHIGGVKSLVGLNLRNTGIRDEYLMKLAGLKKLEYLDLRGNTLSPHAIDNLQRAVPRCRVVR